MRAVSSGWRTAGSRARVTAPEPGALPSTPTPPQAPGWRGATTDDFAHGMPWHDVGWTLSLVGLLVYVWTTTTYSIALGQAAMIAALIGLVLQGDKIRLPTFLGIFGLFVGWCALGYLGTDYPTEVALGLELLWKIWLIAFVVVNTLKTRAKQRVFLFVMLAAYALYPTRGAIFNYLGGYTVWGRAIWNHAYENPNDLAAFTLLQLGFALALFIREPKGWPKLAALAGIVLLPVVIFLTQSRGALLALIAAAGMLVLMQRRKGRALMAVAAVAIVAGIAAPESAWKRFGGMLKLTSASTIAEADEEGSAAQRFAILKVAADVFKSDPISGVGFRAYAKAHGRQAPISGLQREAGGEKDAHNTYMRVLAETGIVGAALYLAMLVAVIVRAEKVRRRARIPLPRSAQQILFLELGLLMFLVAGLFGSFAQIAVTYILLAFLWTVCQTVTEELDAGHAVAPAAA